MRREFAETGRPPNSLLSPRWPAIAHTLETHPVGPMFVLVLVLFLAPVLRAGGLEKDGRCSEVILFRKAARAPLLLVTEGNKTGRREPV